MNQMNRKKLASLALASVLCVSALAGCSSGSQDSDSSASSDGSTQTIRVGYWGSTCEMALFTAIGYGFLEDEGFDVETVQIGYSDIATLMANDELDMYLCTPTDIMSMKEGLPVYFTDSMHTGCYEAVASADSGIEDVTDLEGATIAVDMIGSVAYVQICSEMARLGYDYTTVNWVVYDSSTMISALESGEIDGFATGDMLTNQAMEEIGAVRFYSNTYDEYLKDTLCCFVGMNTDLVDSDPEAAQRVSNAIRNACEYIEANPEEVVETAIANGFLVTDDPDTCVQLVSSYTWLAGDEDRYVESFKEHLRENYRAGLLDDAPEDEEELEAYYDDFIAEHGRFSG